MIGVKRTNRLCLTGLILFAWLSCASITLAALSQAQEPSAPTDAEQALFIKGQNLYNQSLYHEAIAVFTDFLKRYPQSQIKDMTLLWLGRCQLRAGDVGAAEQTAVRLHEIPDTQFIDLYEGELRAARQALRRTVDPNKSAEPKSNSVRVEPPGTTASAVANVVTGQAIPNVANSANATAPVSKPVAKILPAKTEPTVITKASLLLPPARTTSLPAKTPPPAGYSQPIISLRREQSPGASAVNGVVFYRLLISNNGRRLVKDLMITEQLADELQFASSDPAPATQDSVGRTQRLTFRIAELKPGTSRAFRIAVRLRNGSLPQAVMKSKHSVTYQEAGKTVSVPN